MPALAYTLLAGIHTPEVRCPTTPTTPASTNFCATTVPCLGSPASSSEIRANLTFLPSTVISPFSFKVFTANAAPFSKSLPQWAIPPVSGAPVAIFTHTSFSAKVPQSLLPPEAAALPPPLCPPHAAKPKAAAKGSKRNNLFINLPLQRISSNQNIVTAIGFTCTPLSSLHEKSEIAAALSHRNDTGYVC